MNFSPCVLIPSHDHFRALPQVLEQMRARGLPVIIVDDGSHAEAAQRIAALHDPERGVSVHRRSHNGGKGAAVMQGFRIAGKAGFTHAVQIDADGQHDLSALPTLLDQARAHPEALISGVPVYDGSIPKSRKIGRWITHFWVFVETLSFRITDSMCGFRVYPLEACLALMAKEPPGRHMEFDTEIMVRLFWRGVPPVMVPVRVTYPPDNISNFDVLCDNLRISWMHTRLVLTLPARLPGILARRPPPVETTHWAGLAERGAYWGLRFVAATYRLFGRRACLAVLVPIVAYFHLTGGRQRRASCEFLAAILGRPPTLREGFRHALDFATRALDTLAAWTGAIPPGALRVEDPAGLAAAAADPRGAVLVVSHHGNAELSRALMDPVLRQRLTVLVHTRHAENYHRLLQKFRPEVVSRMLQVTEIGPETAIDLQERIERGEWVAIAGDRIPVLSRGRVVAVPFLGRPAPFSQGPWLLASLLECPVYLLFCRREAPQRWTLSLEPFAERVILPRSGRRDALATFAARYAERLEFHARRAPWQWYNFFDFWGEGSS
jgi:predicted LPLAT superfamily acyltransferase/glycosyltransferase involved in cell wall biosynthesis